MTGRIYSMDEVEVNQMLHEIFEYAVKGLCTSDFQTYKDGWLNKQWYLERIFLACGGSLNDIRKSLECLEGVPPQIELEPGRKEYKK